jgi:hypothetical protein
MDDVSATDIGTQELFVVLFDKIDNRMPIFRTHAKAISVVRIRSFRANLPSMSAIASMLLVHLMSFNGLFLASCW